MLKEEQWLEMKAQPELLCSKLAVLLPLTCLLQTQEQV